MCLILLFSLVYFSFAYLLKSSPCTEHTRAPLYSLLLFSSSYSRWQNVRAPFHAEFTVNANTYSISERRKLLAYDILSTYINLKVNRHQTHRATHGIESAHSRSTSQDTKTIVGHVPWPLMKLEILPNERTKQKIRILCVRLQSTLLTLLHWLEFIIYFVCYAGSGYLWLVDRRCR